MVISVIRAAVGGLWLGNIICHVANGVVGHQYHSIAGDGPFPNAVSALAITTVPWLVGSDRSIDSRARWSIVTIGAAVAFGVHAKYVRPTLPLVADAA
jgi:hypothetical protein